MARRQIHGPVFRKLSPLVRAAANRDPSTRCWRCGLTLTQARAQWGPNVTWTAGHVLDGQADHTLTLGDLQPEHSRCNYRSGASYGNRQRTEPCSPEWR